MVETGGKEEGLWTCLQETDYGELLKISLISESYLDYELSYWYCV